MSEVTIDPAKAYQYIVGPLQHIEPAQLRRVAAELVQRGGEYTACGRSLEAAIACVYPDVPREPEKKLGFEQAYGDMTLPLGGE